MPKELTGNKTFDRQNYGVMRGNVVAPTQISGYIRPSHLTECNGHTFPVGHLRDFDMRQFPALPIQLCAIIGDLVNKHNGGILYQIHHWRGDQRILHGFLLTTTDYPTAKYIRHWNMSYRETSVMVMTTVIKQLCEGYPT